MYISNLKYAHLTSVFRLHNIHLVFSTCPHKYKWLLCTEKPVFNASTTYVYWLIIISLIFFKAWHFIWSIVHIISTWNLTNKLDNSFLSKITNFYVVSKCRFYIKPDILLSKHWHIINFNKTKDENVYRYAVRGEKDR